MSDDLYRPLGLDLAPVGEARRRVRLRPLAGWSAAVCLVAASGTLAWREPAPMPVAVAAPPEPEAPVAVAELEAPRLPTIVRSEPGGGVTITGGDGMPIVDADNPYTGSVRVLEPGSLRQPERFAALPDDALIEASDFGPLPARAGDGRRPLDVYAGASSGTLGTRVAIVVGGLGISQTGTQVAVETLPAGVTLAFAASGNSLDRWMRAARQRGHELLLQAPMEPFGYPEIDPGQGTLTVADAGAGAFDALHWSMGRLTNYVGVMNFMGARFNSEPAALEPFLAEIARRGLLYLDDGSSSRSQARDVAQAGNVPFAGADLLLDANREPDAIRAQLDALERVARARGTAIGVASAFDVSVAEIRDWAARAASRGIEVVPVSAIAFDPETR